MNKRPWHPLPLLPLSTHTPASLVGVGEAGPQTESSAETAPHQLHLHTAKDGKVISTLRETQKAFRKPTGCTKVARALGGSSSASGPSPRAQPSLGEEWRALTGGLARAISGGSRSNSNRSSRGSGRRAREIARRRQAARAIRPGAAGPAGPGRAAAPYSIRPAPPAPGPHPPPPRLPLPFVLNSTGLQQRSGLGRSARRGWIP